MVQRQSLPDAGKPTPRDLIGFGCALKDTSRLLYRPPGKIGSTVQRRCTAAFLFAQLTPRVPSLRNATREPANLSLWDWAEADACRPMVQAAARAAVRNLLILGYAGQSRPL